MDKKKKCFMVLVVLFLVWLCRPLPSEEKKIEDLFQLGFSPSMSIEETTELPKDRMGEFLKETEESRPFQFELAESQMRAFLIDGKEYVISPEAGLLLLPDGTIAPLSHEKYALGVFIQDDAIYHARAEEKRHLWLPGVFTEGTILVSRYEMEYRRFYPEIGDFDVLTEEEELNIQRTVTKQ